MEREKDILQLADYYEKFEVGDSSAYLIINKSMKEYQAMFGFARLSEKKDEWERIFALMEARARQLGHRSLIGPLNYSTWMSYRWAISRFDLNLFPDCTNPPYYPDYIKELGYRELYTYRSAEIVMENPLHELGGQVYNEKMAEGYRFVRYEGEEALHRVREVYEISIDAFSDAFLYSELPYKVFEKLYLAWVREISISLIIAYLGEEAIGYVFGYENPFGKAFISKTSAVKKEYQKHKLYLALLYLGCELVKHKGYDTMMYHFQCEQKGTFRRFEEGVEDNEKRYAVYVKELREPE